jgi:hypothetical protein
MHRDRAVSGRATLSADDARASRAARASVAATQMFVVHLSPTQIPTPYREHVVAASFRTLSHSPALPGEVWLAEHRSPKFCGQFLYPTSVLCYARDH